jgi:mono/diheme cytochrome c family protein
MRKALKALVIGLAAIAGIVILGVLYFLWKFPDVGPAPVISVTATPERLSRGAYLANHVTVCIDCHSDRDWRLFSGPTVRGTEGRGGFRLGEELGIPGTIYTANITPAAISSMTDGELFRTIVSGVGRDGHVLFPLMPYPSYNKMTEEDILSVIAYVRTLSPIENQVPEAQLSFPVNFLIRTAASRYEPVPSPDTSDHHLYGKYLTTAAACADCHTPLEDAKPLPGMEFAGGREFPFPEGVVRSANITPDEETGIGVWTEDIFIAKFKQYENADTTWLKEAADPHNTPMPWTMYAGMTEKDLLAIYKYLRSIMPVVHNVERFTAAGR